MRKKSLLIMLLVALFVPLAMNAQTKMQKRIMGSSQLEMKVSPKVTPSNTQLSIPQSLREAALEELNGRGMRAVGDYELVTSEQVDWSGDYVITAMSSSTSAYVMTGKASGGNYGAYTTVTVNNNTISSSAVNSYKVTITEYSLNNTYYCTIKQGNYYLALTQAGNYLYFVTTDPATQTGNNRLRGLWTISYEDDDYVKITNAYTTSRYIRFNTRTNQQRFACYQSSSTNVLDVSLFKYNDGSCVPPTDFEATDVDLESATFSWTENGQSQYWVIYYMGENDATTSYEIATSNPFTLSGLTPATTYYALVTPYCGGLDQDSDVIEFTTDDYPCPAPTDLYADDITTTSATLNWTSEAGSYSVQYREAASDGDVVFFDDFENGLDNWTLYTEGTASAWRVTDPSSGLSWSGHNGSTYVAISMSWNNTAYTADNWLVTPQLDLGGTLKFYVYTNQSYPDDYEVKLSTGGNAVRDFTVTLQELASIPTTGDWVEVSIDLSRYAGQRGYIAIHHSFYDGNYILVDDFGVYQGGSEAGPWIPATPNGNSANLTGLDPETTYEWQVMADCGSDGESLWASSSFTTLSACAAPTGLSSEPLINTATLSWTGYTDAYNIQYREVDPTAPATLILNVPTDIWDDGTGYQLVLDADHNTYGTTIPETANFTAGTFADFEYTIPENAVCDASTNTIVVNGSASITIPAGVYDYVFLNPDPSSGTYYIASGNGFPSRGDDFEFVAGMTYEFTLSIVGSNDYITLTETADWTAVSGTVTSPYTLTGLDPETTYEWQVKGDGCDDWSAGNTFTTLNGTLVESISADNVTVLVGQTATITPTVLPAEATNPAVTYASTDETIATVNENGVVTGVGVGQTTITIAATDGSGVSTQITVTVNGIDVETITASDVTVVNGQTATISYTVTPNNATDPSVTFTSADVTIATVDAEGVVTGVGVGTTTITIASVSNPEVTAIINVTVTSDPNAVQFTVNAPAITYAGDTITVAGVVAAPTSGNYTGICSLILDITYDNTAFAFVSGSITNGPVATQAQQTGALISTGTLDNAVQLSIINAANNMTTTGVVFSAQFTVLAGAQGNYTFTAIPHEDNVMNYDLELLPYEATPSTVFVGECYTKDIIGRVNGGGWFMIASPVVEDITPSEDNGFITDNGTAPLTYDLYSYNQSAVNQEWQNYRAHHFDIENGKGYLYSNENDVTLTFVGTSRTETEVSVDLDYDADAFAGLDGWNFLGNPFAGNAYCSEPFYVLDATATNIHGATEGDAIPIMEGVFVQSSETGQSVTFSTSRPAMRASTLTLNITQGNGLVDRAIVRFDEGSTLSKFQIFETTKVYIPVEGKDYAIVRSESMGELPVNFKAVENGTYTLGFSNQEVEFGYLHLIDNMTGKDIDLLQTQTYTFNAKTTDYESRFKLVFATGNNTNDDNFAFFSNGNFVINNEGNATLQVIDVNGRIVKSESINGCADVNVNAAAGVYMLRLINGNNVKVQKVVVK